MVWILTLESVVVGLPPVVPWGSQAKPADEAVAAETPAAMGTSRRPARTRLAQNIAVNRRIGLPPVVGHPPKRPPRYSRTAHMQEEPSCRPAVMESPAAPLSVGSPAGGGPAHLAGCGRNMSTELERDA